MKKILGSLTALALLMGSGTALAAPFKAQNNPQIVANYPDGLHGIPGETEDHEGADVVMRAGNSGNFQQWFYGTSASESLHGDHSVWKLSKDGTCPNGWLKMANTADNFWGNYLVTDGIYCIHTNDFKPSR
jgi:hypothetical protein